MPIIRRESSTCKSVDHQDVYFKRKTNPRNFDAWETLMVTWRVTGTNKFHDDFEIYSTLEDALTN